MEISPRARKLSSQELHILIGNGAIVARNYFSNKKWLQ
jgi:hypothetical protein